MKVKKILMGICIGAGIIPSMLFAKLLPIEKNCVTEKKSSELFERSHFTDQQLVNTPHPFSDLESDLFKTNNLAVTITVDENDYYTSSYYTYNEALTKDA